MPDVPDVSNGGLLVLWLWRPALDAPVLVGHPTTPLRVSLSSLGGMLRSVGVVVVVLACVDAGSAVVRVRRGGGIDEVDLTRSAVVAFDDVLPWRTFRWRHGQAHYSGLYWSAVMNGHVGYESRLELAWLLLADRDRRARRFLSQPFQLVAWVDGRLRRHVPDFVMVRDDGLVTVVDVKPRRRLDDDAVSFTFGWTRRVVAEQGWEFEVFSEPDPVVLANVRLLAGYRREWLFDPLVLAATSCAADPWATFATVERDVIAAVGDGAVVRGHLLHALWSGRLRADLRLPLAETTVLAVA